LKHRLIVSALAAAFPLISQGQDGGTLFDDSRVEFRVGGQIFTNLSTRLRIDSETLGIGTELSLEQDLSVEDALQVGRVDAVFRFNRRHGVAMSFYDIARDGAKLTTEDIQFGDTFYPEGTPVNSEFDQNIFKLAYRFRFVEKERATFGGSFGLHTMQIDTSLRALDGALVQEQSADAPLPVFGVQGTYEFGERWRFNGSAEWFDVQVGDLQGTFLDALLSVEHETFENFGIGFGLNRFQLDVEAGDENLRGMIDITFDAAVIYFLGSFGLID